MFLEQVRVELALMSRNKQLYCRECDLSSQKSIRQFANNFHKGLNLYLSNYTIYNIIKCL